jgi:hypothetical protein
MERDELDPLEAKAQENDLNYVKLGRLRKMTSTT